VTGELMAFQVKGKGKGGQWKGGYNKGYGKGAPSKGGYSKGSGKGGGKGGPFMGKCFNCGREGHPARDCPDLGKGFKGTCFTCGGKGHRAAQCSAGKGSGGGGETGHSKSVEAETGDQTNGAFSILPSSVGQALSLGGYLATIEKHEEKHVITIGDCKWSVAGRRGKKTKTHEEISRSVEVMRQIQIDQEERRKATQGVNVGALKSRYEAISPDEEQVPLKITYKQKCADLKCQGLKCGGMKHGRVTCHECGTAQQPLRRCRECSRSTCTQHFTTHDEEMCFCCYRRSVDIEEKVVPKVILLGSKRIGF
jgi:hypothetical protein